jgi:3-deoxy-D-manno-octulosonic-acid transferase
MTHFLQVAWSMGATLAAPLLRRMIRRRLDRGKELPGRTGERFGVDPTLRPEGKLIWLHAASVGETVSILPVISALPVQCSVLLTTGTVTSAELLAKRLPELGLAGRVIHRFVPLDVPAWISRFLDHWRPDVAGFVESELWPNLLAGCRQRHIPVMLINARMSARSFANWSRLPGFARHVLAGFDLIQAQTETYAERLSQLGGERVTAPGDLKFAAPDLPADPVELDRLRAALGDRPLWLAASTHPGEDELIFAAHRVIAASHPGLLTIIVPRHPERGERIALLAGDVPVGRRAAGDAPPDAGVWVADTLGELGLFYRLAPVVFVGRSLIPPGGGQNPLEPARLGCAVAVGPFTGNFDSATEVLSDVGALARVTDAASLAAWVDDMLRHPERRASMGAAAAAASGRFAGLPAQTAAALAGLGAA